MDAAVGQKPDSNWEWSRLSPSEQKESGKCTADIQHNQKRAHIDSRVPETNPISQVSLSLFHKCHTIFFASHFVKIDIGHQRRNCRKMLLDEMGKMLEMK